MKKKLQNSPGATTTIEKPPHYDLEIEQPENGYRYNQDPFLLARFIKEHRDQWRAQLNGKCLDMGTGVGILPLLLAPDFPDTHFTGIEIQKELATLASNNVRRNRLNQQIKIITADYYDLNKKSSFSENFQMIICNPPYYPENGGRLNLCPQKCLARHEITGNLENLVRTAASYLATKGLFVIIFPAERLVELTTHLKSQKLEPKHLKFIHPNHSDRAGNLLLAARKHGAPGIIIENPLMI
ncbi:MAG: hypothetical protein DRH03_11655 [Deltaproteobacteria bacterium]|nr:MAG: hypothetical protein DRH03_11655 [Deltaproteobacteria bacterium]